MKEYTSEELLKQRQLIIKPLADTLFAYLKSTQKDVAKGEAYEYILNQEKYLRVFLNDGDVPMDNKPANGLSVDSVSERRTGR